MFKLFKKRNKPSAGFSLGPSESPSLVHRKQRLQRLFIILMFVLLVASITDIPTFNNPSGEYDIDAEPAASQNIVAKFPFKSENREATREQKELAAMQVPNTWRIDIQRVNDSLQNLERGITSITVYTSDVEEAIHKALFASSPNETPEEIVEKTVRELLTQLKADSLAKGFPEVDDLVITIATTR